MQTRLEALLGLSLSPVAIGFLATPPRGLARVTKAAPASCGYWSRAAQGEAFYTEPADHLGCAIGAHTHGIPTTATQKEELMQLIHTMVGLEYLSMDEVPCHHRPAWVPVSPPSPGTRDPPRWVPSRCGRPTGSRVAPSTSAASLPLRPSGGRATGGDGVGPWSRWFRYPRWPAATVPNIPHRDSTEPNVIAYAPLGAATFPVDLVLVRGDVRQLMLLAEAAQSAGVGSGAPTLGRPTCAVLPQAQQTMRASASFGCVGNRVYTGARETEGYYAIPGAALLAIEAKLEVVLHANAELGKFHQARKAALS